jgi:hypothetical protein
MHHCLTSAMPAKSVVHNHGDARHSFRFPTCWFRAIMAMQKRKN